MAKLNYKSYSNRLVRAWRKDRRERDASLGSWIETCFDYKGEAEKEKKLGWAMLFIGFVIGISMILNYLALSLLLVWQDIAATAKEN